MRDFIKQFMTEVDCTTDEVNVPQASLYIGLILEEVSELLVTLGHDASRLINLSNQYKKNEYNKQIEQLIENGKLPEVLDHCMDIVWVSYGLSYSIGADVNGAENEVSTSNLSKTIDKLRDPITNKVIKGPSFIPADFSKYVQFKKN